MSDGNPFKVGDEVEVVLINGIVPHRLRVGECHEVIELSTSAPHTFANGEVAGPHTVGIMVGGRKSHYYTQCFKHQGGPW